MIIFWFLHYQIKIYPVELNQNRGMFPFIFDAKWRFLRAFSINIDLAFSFLEYISKSGIDLVLSRTTVKANDSVWG